MIPFYHDPDVPIQPDQYAEEFDLLLSDPKQDRRGIGVIYV